MAADNTVTSITYPALLPTFPPLTENALTSGNKKEVLSVYSEIITEAARYYCPLLPTDTGRAKCAFDNIGRTIVEKYPVLAVTDAKVTWSYFNGKLSSALRNMRCRIKRKLSGQSTASVTKKSCTASVSAVHEVPSKLGVVKERIRKNSH